MTLMNDNKIKDLSNIHCKLIFSPNQYISRICLEFSKYEFVEKNLRLKSALTVQYFLIFCRNWALAVNHLTFSQPLKIKWGASLAKMALCVSEKGTAGSGGYQR